MFFVRDGERIVIRLPDGMVSILRQVDDAGLGDEVPDAVVKVPDAEREVMAQLEAEVAADGIAGVLAYRLAEDRMVVDRLLEHRGPKPFFATLEEADSLVSWFNRMYVALRHREGSVQVGEETAYFDRPADIPTSIVTALMGRLAIHLVEAIGEHGPEWEG